MRIKEFFATIHRFVGRLVLGRRLVRLDAECTANSTARKESIRLRVEALEKRANKACEDAGIPVANGMH